MSGWSDGGIWVRACSRRGARYVATPSGLSPKDERPGWNVVQSARVVQFERIHIPGSTLVTQSSPVLVPFSTTGKVSSTSGPPWSRAARASFQLYICNREPDEPASMTIPKRREASHESLAVGGGIYKRRPAAEWGVARRSICRGRRGQVDEIWKSSAVRSINFDRALSQMGAWKSQSPNSLSTFISSSCFFLPSSFEAARRLLRCNCTHLRGHRLPPVAEHTLVLNIRNVGVEMVQRTKTEGTSSIHTVQSIHVTRTQDRLRQSSSSE